MTRGDARPECVTMRLINIILLLALATAQFKLWFGNGGVREVERIGARVAAQRAENAELLERNKVLALEIRDLKDGLDAVEEQAREEFGLIGPNESFYQVVDAISTP